jgi:hypothetical protein
MKSAQSLLDDIPRHDALKALQELTDWVEALNRQADDFKLDHQWAVLRLLDQAAQGHVRKLLHDYFVLQPLSQFQENRLWSLLVAYYTQSDLAHSDVLRRYLENARGASSIRSDLPLLCTRGIDTIGGLLKMDAARFAMVDPALWKRLAAYYQLAESKGFANEVVSVYTGTQLSASEAFAILMLWYGSSAGNLNPVQKHISERLCSAAGKGAQVVGSYDGSALFVFDMAQPTPPMRVSAESSIHPALRYIAAAGLRQALDSMIRTLDKGILPDGLNLYGANFETEMVKDIAGRLVQNLTLPSPTRRTPRRKIKVNLKIANGFLKMLEQSDLGLNFGAEESEVWEVEDISATGFRSVVKPSHFDGLRIGSLVGSKPESVSHWGAGVVRRLSRDRDGALHVGVEVLSPRVVGVPLQDRALPGAEGGQLGLFLNRPAGASGEAWVLMKQDSYSPQRSLNMMLDGKSYLLLPLALVERGDDYDLARYRMMEQDGSSED